jgi:hypothetical protein
VVSGVRITHHADGGYSVDCRPEGALKFKPAGFHGTPVAAITRAADLLGVRAVVGDDADKLARERDCSTAALSEVRKALHEACPVVTEKTLNHIDAICDTALAGNISAVMSVIIPAGMMIADDIGLLSASLQSNSATLEIIPDSSAERIAYLERQLHLPLCPRCLKRIGGDGVHTCTPTDAWRSLEQQAADANTFRVAAVKDARYFERQRDDLLVAVENIAATSGGLPSDIAIAVIASQALEMFKHCLPAELIVPPTAEHRCCGNSNPRQGKAMKRRYWTTGEEDIMRRLYPVTPTKQVAAIVGRNERQVFNKAHDMGLDKDPEYLASADACRIHRGSHPGSKKTQFKAGHKTWNKGIRWDAGGRSVETRFKPGQKPHSWNPIGHERVTKDGYRERKMTDTGVTRHDYVGLHHLLWEEHNGPVPKGHAVIFRDGNKENITIENLELVTRAELMRRNSVHNYGPEIARLHQLKGAITRQINKRKGKPE